MAGGDEDTACMITAFEEKVCLCACEMAVDAGMQAGPHGIMQASIWGHARQLSCLIHPHCVHVCVWGGCR